jgi:flagellar motor switch protein FliG
MKSQAFVNTDEVLHFFIAASPDRGHTFPEDKHMAEACMFEILDLTEDDLKKVLPKASTRSLAKLVLAYPRAFGKTFLEILTACVSDRTIAFIQEEVGLMRIPSYPEIRTAESEIMKIIRDEHLEDRLSCDRHATALPQ